MTDEPKKQEQQIASVSMEAEVNSLKGTVEKLTSALTTEREERTKEREERTKERANTAAVERLGRAKVEAEKLNTTGKIMPAQMKETVILLAATDEVRKIFLEFVEKNKIAPLGAAMEHGGPGMVDGTNKLVEGGTGPNIAKMSTEDLERWESIELLRRAEADGAFGVAKMQRYQTDPWDEMFGSALSGGEQ